MNGFLYRQMHIQIVGILIVFAVAAGATPWFTQDPRTLPKDKWRVEEHLLATDIDDSLVDGNRVPLQAGPEASELVLHTRIRYGVTDDLTVFGDFPYVENEITQQSGTETDHEGLGDMLFLAKYKYHEDRKAGTRRAVAVFAKPHNGDYRNLSPLLATGTGTTNIGVNHLWEKKTGDTTWYASLGYVHTGERDDINMDPGEVVFGNLAAEETIGDGGWKAVGELNARHQGTAERAGNDVPNSDWTALSVSPGIQHYDRLEGGRKLIMEAGVQLPMWYGGDRGALKDYTIYAGGFLIF